MSLPITTDTERLESLLSAGARSMRFSAIRRLSALVQRPGIISFAPGQPSPETFPVAEFQEILEDIVERQSAEAFQYTLTRGLPALVSAVRAYAARKGMPSTAEETIVTEGSQQGLDLVTRVLVDPGDVVLVELPSYIGATSAFRASQARLVGVRLDDDGIDLDDLRRRHAEALAGQLEDAPVGFGDPLLMRVDDEVAHLLEVIALPLLTPRADKAVAEQRRPVARAQTGEVGGKLAIELAEVHIPEVAREGVYLCRLHPSGAA